MEEESQSTHEKQPADPFGGLSVGVLARGSALYAIANIGDKVVSFFVLVPLYAHYLSPAAYGIIALSDSVAQLIVRLFGLSLDDSLRRLYFQYVDSPKERADYVSTVLWGATATILAMLAISFGAVPRVMHRFFPRFEVPFYPYIAFSVIAAIGVHVLLYRQTLYQVQAQPQKYLRLSLLSFTANVAFAVAFVVILKRGAYGMLLAKMCAGGLIAALSVFLLRHCWTRSFFWPFMRETLILAMPLIPHYLTTYLLDVSDRFILARYRTIEEVGTYSLAYNLGRAMYIVSLSVHQAWSPTFYAIARHGEAGKERLGRATSMLAIFLIWVASAGTLGVQVFISQFLDRRYLSAAQIAPWVIGSFLFQALYALSMLSAMQAKRSILLLASSFAALVVNVVLNFALVPRFGMLGAAYANLASFMAIAIVMYWLAQRVFVIPYLMPRILAALIVYFLCLGITQLPISHLGVNLATFVCASFVLYRLSGSNFKTIRALLLRRSRIVGETEPFGNN